MPTAREVEWEFAEPAWISVPSSLFAGIGGHAETAGEVRVELASNGSLCVLTRGGVSQFPVVEVEDPYTVNDVF